MPARHARPINKPLRNLGPTSLRWLAAIDVTAREDLERLGAVEAFLRVRDVGFRPSKNLLWALRGALLDVRWDELPAELKKQLWREVEEAT